MEVLTRQPHAVDAFTQGLELYRGFLYESTGGLGQSSVRVVDPASGEVVLRRALAPELYGEGLTVMRGRVYQLTLHAGRCLVYDAASLEPIGEHAYEGEGWGLAHDEHVLLMSDGSDELRFLDPETFVELRRIAVSDGGEPVAQLNELEMVEGELWANVWRSERIARIDPQTGRVIAWLDASTLVREVALSEPEAVLNGIAYDAGARRLYVTGKLWPTLYGVTLPLSNPPESLAF